MVDIDYAKQIMEKCIKCGKCMKECLLLQEIGEFPVDFVAHGVTAEEAFSCALCGACESACPLALSPCQVFGSKRFETVKNKKFDVNQYRFLFPDRVPNIMSYYRDFYGVKYNDIVLKDNAATVFFPGCTMMTYAPKLTRKVFDILQKGCGCEGVLLNCCGKSLRQMGLQANLDQMRAKLVDIVKKHRISKMIFACPSCYYELEELLTSLGVVAQTVYEAIAFSDCHHPEAGVCTIHDACPDRYAGIFSQQVRDVLKKCGFLLREMKHNRKNTLCCGSGGLVVQLRPDLAEKQVDLRLKEAENLEPDVLVGYCMSCVLQFLGAHPDISVKHVLTILLGCDEDYSSVGERVSQMFAGPDGEAAWKRLMED